MSASSTNLVLALGNLLLVSVTLFYAWQTREMVREMRRARGLQLLPKLVPTLKLLGRENAFLRVVNSGPGPAFDVHIEFSLEPGGLVREWSSPFVASGEVHDYWPAEDADGQGRFHLPTLVAGSYGFRLKGRYKDALGSDFEVDELLDIRGMWERVYKAREVMPHDWAEETAKNVAKLGDHLRRLVDLERDAVEAAGSDDDGPADSGTVTSG